MNGSVVIAKIAGTESTANIRSTNYTSTSALPLNNQEQDAVKKSFGAKEVSFKVNPAILGGLVVKIGDKVLDGSVAGKLEGLRQTLK